METLSDVIALAFEIFLVAAMIGIIFLLARNAIASSNEANDGAVDLAKQAADYSITKYDSEIVSGADILRLIDKYKDDGVEITIQTYRYQKKQLADGNANANGVFKIDNPDSEGDNNDIYYSQKPKFIDPNWKFTSYVTFDDNDVLSELQFIELQQ